MPTDRPAVLTPPGGPPRESTGHSRQLRRILQAKRKERGLTQDQVARAIGERLDDGRTYTGAAVSEWERFTRHPPIDVMACWSRVVGLRLVVELDDAKGERIPVLLHPRTADLARQLDAMSDADFEIARTVIERMGRRT